MARTSYRKLIRDGIPEIIRGKGEEPIVTTLSEAEFVAALKAKVLEEGEELHKAETPDDVLNELADLAELIAAVAAEYGFTVAAVEDARAKKREDRGGFTQRLFLEAVDEPEE